jgi:hypothetical protein
MMLVKAMILGGGGVYGLVLLEPSSCEAAHENAQRH